ncbi:gliding motility-associated protein GldE [bacterium]|nr:gliding motility-associated protein GldE [bacterium]
MESDGEPGNQVWLLLFAAIDSPAVYVSQIIGLLLLLFISALVSGSEVAFFSLKGEELNLLKNSENATDKTILQLLHKPKHLLATILITNNVVNIAIVVLSTSITQPLLQLSNPLLEFIIQVVVVTFLLVLLGEVTPKIYAQYRNVQMARAVVYPMNFFNYIFYPFAQMLVRSSSFFEKRISKYQSELSKEELNQAIELTSDEETSQEEKNILKGIVNFGDITVKQIMKPRQEVVAYPAHIPFDELKDEINKHRFSRLPIYEGDLDRVLGILHVKDLLPHLSKNADFNWSQLIRKPYFVPEMKEIDDLLKDFQLKKMHMAIVVDEYGGTEGVVTLEDVLEEIVGEIHDEFDDNEVFYSKLSDTEVVFDAKTSLSDVVKVMHLEPELFDEYKSQVESIGGLATELNGKIPRVGEVIDFNGFELKIESADRKKIRRIKMSQKPENTENNN